MSAWDHDALLQLEKLLDWEASERIKELPADDSLMGELREMEVFREAMAFRIRPRGGLVEETMALLPSEPSRTRSLRRWLANSAAASVACIVFLLFLTGLESSAGPATAAGLEPSGRGAVVAIALVISAIFGFGWAEVKRRRS